MISLYDMLEAADGQLFGEPAAQIFTDFALDLDQVEPGCLFVALKTAQGDGHTHIREAVRRGALGVVCSQPPGFDTDGVTVMIVRDAEHALMNWARVVLRKFGTTVIGVAGAAGKSTAKECIAAVLGARYNVYKNPGSYSGRFGLPLALGKLTAQHQLAVLELAANQPGEMAELVDVVRPLVGVMTNSGHIFPDQPDSPAELTDEGAALVESLPENGLAVLNYDDALVRGMTSRAKATVFSVGIDSFEADLLAYNIVAGRYKTGFDLRYGAERYVGRWLPLLGRHQLYGAMAALAVGLSYQIPLEDSLRALTQVEPLPGRLRPLNGVGGCLLVDDTFSANLESTEAALEWLGSVREDEGRLIFVMGDLDRLGDYAARAYRRLGEQVASCADVLVTQGNLAAIAARAALDEGMPRGQVHMTFSPSDVVTVLRDNLGPRDVVLVKGSASVRMERVVRQLLANEQDARLLARQEMAGEQIWAGQPSRSSWIEVDLEATANNVRRLKEIIGPDVALMAVVSADAYGHGALATGSAAVLHGATYLGVASLAEAVALRDGGLDTPILVLGYTPLSAVRDALQYNLTLTVYDLEMARLYDRLAHEARQPLRVHVNIDTGLGRLGLSPDDVTALFRALKGLTHLRVEGLYTQLAAPVEDDSYTHEQLELFRSLVGPVLATGLDIPYIHAAESAALLTLPESHFTMVRDGLALHGLSPLPEVRLPPGFRLALTWKTVIAQIKELPRGSFVGEGKAYRTGDTERIAVIPVGYADGLRGGPRRWHQVIVRGQRAPLVGQVGPHEAAVNVTRVADVQPGDEVVLIGRQGSQVITAEEVAEVLNVRVEEVLSGILPRSARL